MFNITVVITKQIAETTVTRANIDSKVFVLFFAKKVSELPAIRPLNPFDLLGCIITDTIIAIEAIICKTIRKLCMCVHPLFIEYMIILAYSKILYNEM
jgi:hypothetical protein